MGQENRATLTLRQAELADWAFWQSSPIARRSSLQKRPRAAKRF